MRRRPLLLLAGCAAPLWHRPIVLSASQCGLAAWPPLRLAEAPLSLYALSKTIRVLVNFASLFCRESFSLSFLSMQNRPKVGAVADHTMAQQTLQKTHSASLLCLQNTLDSSDSESVSSASDSHSDVERDPAAPESRFARLSSALQARVFPPKAVSPMRLADELEVVAPPVLTTTSQSTTSSSAANAGPSIFKKMMSRKALIPKLKAFKRISDELQIENCPLDDEIHHELMITSALNTANPHVQFKGVFGVGAIGAHTVPPDNVKRFELINKANEAWNKKNRRVSTSSLESARTIKSSASRRGSVTNLSALNKARQKRKHDAADDSFNTEEMDYSDDGLNSKRRLVSVSVANSPVMDSPFSVFDTSRRNSVLAPNIFSASEEFELLNLK